MIRCSLTGALCALALGCTTFAPVGRIEYQSEDSEGRARSNFIMGLFAVPTPRGNTIVLIPLYKSYELRRSPAGAGLPSSAQRWMSEASGPSPAGIVAPPPTTSTIGLPEPAPSAAVPSSPPPPAP